MGLVKWTTHYERNANFQFNYDLFAKFSKQEESDERLSYLNGTLNNQIGTNKADQPFAITQNFDSYWNVNSAQVMALEMQWLLQKERPDFIQELSNQPNIATLLAPDLIAANSYKLEQTQETFNE